MNAEALHLSLRSVGGVLRSWGASLNRQVAARPGTAAVVITGTKACAADALVQCVEDRGWWGSASLPWDWRRTALFTIFGAGYQGGAQYLVFNRVLDAAWPGCKLASAFPKVLTANFVCDPLLFFPAFYTLKEISDPAVPILQSLSNPLHTAEVALGKYREHALQDWVNSWKFWIPGHIVSFGFCPPHLRFPWMATVSFGYCCMLSYSRGQLDDESAAHVSPAAAAFPSRRSLREQTFEHDVPHSLRRRACGEGEEGEGSDRGGPPCDELRRPSLIHAPRAREVHPPPPPPARS